jgi:hypothetical protein
LKILRHVDAGDDVEVISVFTEGEKSGHEMRRQEDIKACAALGVEAVHLGFFDAPFRNSRYSQIEQIVFGNMDEQDNLCIQSIVLKLNDLIAQNKPAQIYAPLAAGNHIDHRLVWSACQFLPSFESILYYEDKPYVLWPGILDTRLNNIGIIRKTPSVVTTEMASAVNQHYFLQSFVPDGPIRANCLPFYIKELEQSIKNFQQKLKAEIIDLSANEKETNKIWLALQLYKSQISFLYKSTEDFMSGDIYRERYWKLQNL